MPMSIPMTPQETKGYDAFGDYSAVTMMWGQGFLGLMTTTFRTYLVTRGLCGLCGRHGLYGPAL